MQRDRRANQGGPAPYGTSGDVPTERETSPKRLADLPPELRTLALRRARFESGDRSVHREVVGRQGQQMAKGVDDWDVW